MPMSNPYASPQFASNVTPEPEQREKLRRVAKYQRWVLFALLANIVSYVIFMMGSIAGHEGISRLAGIVFLLSAVFAMVAIFLLAQAIYNTVVALICAVVMFIPCIAFITLAIVNSKATSYLQAHGVKVGFMGANPEMI
jgi:uncharacterized membrane protein